MRVRKGLFSRIKKKYWDTRISYVPKKKVVANINEDEEFNENGLDNFETDTNSKVYYMQDQKESIQDRESLNVFLSTNFEPAGYHDAVANSDISYANSKKDILKYQLELKCEGALRYYRNKVAHYDLYIKNGHANGMIDTITEIETEKAISLEEIKRIETILAEAKENKGVGHIIILSYERGFKRGLAAVTAAKLFGNNLDNE